MREIIIRCGDVVPLGRAGENQALAVLFDVTGWEESFGSGTFTLAVQRPGEALAYQREVTREGDQVRWVVSDVDTGIAGTGEVQLRYSVGDTLAKSAVYQTVISPSVGDIGPAPDPYEDVLEEIQGYAEDAAASATAAETSRGQAEQRATEAAGSATQAAGSATAAAASAAAAQTAAERDVPAATTAWLEAHVDPETGYVLDSSLSIQGAAADAAAVGHFRDALQISSNLSSVSIGQGNITSSGSFSNSSTRCRTANITLPPGYVNISIADGYKFIPRSFDSPDAGSSHYIGSPSGNQWTTWCQVDRTYAPYLRIVIAYEDDTSAITPEDCAGKLTIIGSSYTDDTLAVLGKAADAKASGDAIAAVSSAAAIFNAAAISKIIPGLFLNTSGAIRQITPGNPDRLLVMAGVPGQRYQIRKDTATMMRVGCGATDNPALNDTVVQYAGFDEPSSDPLYVTPTAANPYIYIHLFSDADDASLQSIDANRRTLVVKPVNVTACIIGASLEAGYTKETASAERVINPSKAYLTVALQNNGVEVTNLSVSGMGYLQKGDGDASFKAIVDATDFTAFDSVYLCIGGNDWNKNKPLGAPSDAVGSQTVCGMLKYGIEKVLTSNPWAKVFIIMPRIRATRGDFSTLYGWLAKNTAAVPYSLKDMHTAAQDVCEQYGIEFFSTKWSGIANAYNILTVYPDGTHPTVFGMAQMAKDMTGRITYR